MSWRTVTMSAITAAGVTATACVADEPASDPLRPHGSYLCTVEQKAGIASEMLEGGPPPTAFVDNHGARFRLSISPHDSRDQGQSYELKQQPLTSGDRKTQSEADEVQLLQGLYTGDGWRFTATGEQAFLRFEVANVETGWLWFYHAGFEKPDADHVNLSVRSGTCAPDA